MHLLYVGLTHRETPLPILEKAHFSDQEGLKALKLLKREKSILENIILQSDRALSGGGPAAHWPLLFQAFFGGLVSDSCQGAGRVFSLS